MELEYIQDAYTNKSYKVISTTEPGVEVKVKKTVSFDSKHHLDEIFSKAISYAKKQNKKGQKSTKNCKLFVGIDVVSYGASNAKMSYVSKNRINDETNIELVENHIGNLKLMADYNEKDIQFIEEFQLMIKAAFNCFGKRWYELSQYDVNIFQTDNFSLVEIDQYPYIYFDKAHYFRIETIVCKFFESILKCISSDIFRYDNKLKNLCIAIPSDFHTYQRLILKNCLDNIGLKHYIITIKSIALAMPFFAQDRTDSSRKLIIDFGSGYLNCSILQLTDNNNVRVSDHLADQTVSSKKFFENCYRSIKKKIKNKTSDKIINSQIKNNLYKVMNANRNNEPQYSKDKRIREHWTLKTNGVTFDLNMTELGAKKLAKSVIEKFKTTHLINRDTNMIENEIRDILICSDDILFEYLEPMLFDYLGPNTKITFMDLDCATLGGAFLASTDMNIFDMLSFPISMGMYNGVLKPLIEAKKNFPCVGKYLFQTIVDNQKTVRVNLYEGFNPLARNNKHICEIQIDNKNSAMHSYKRNKIELFIILDVNGLLDAYAEETETREKLDLIIDFDPKLFPDFERDPNEPPVNINKKMHRKRFEKEQTISKFLDDLDYYLEYLIVLYKYSPLQLKKFIFNKVLQAKKYLSKNRFKITVEECHQLACELDVIVKTNQPFDKASEELYNNKNHTHNSALCNIL